MSDSLAPRTFVCFISLHQTMPLGSRANIIKEIKNAPSALLSYISTREFLRTRKKCSETRAVGECPSALLECS